MNISFSKIASLKNLSLAVHKLQQEQPLLKDRHWLHTGIEEKLQQIQVDLVSNNYVFSPIEYYYTWQDKYILTAQMSCRDWVVHHAICLQVGPFFYQHQHEFSAYQPKDTQKLIAQVQRWKRQYDWVLGLDIKSFFESIQHDDLMQNISISIKDTPTVALLQPFLKALNDAALAFAMQESSFKHEENQALPIGLELCYILANAYLQTIDLELKNEVFARYIDDFLIFSEDEKKLWQVKEQLEQVLEKKGLRFNEEKTFLKSTQERFVYLRFLVG